MPADPYEHFHVQWRDMSIYLAAADFDWRTAEATALENCDAVLERCGAVATIALLNGAATERKSNDQGGGGGGGCGGGGGGGGGGGPPVRVKVRLPAIAVNLSPGRIARVLAIVAAATGRADNTRGGGGGGGGGGSASAKHKSGGVEDAGGGADASVGDGGGGKRRAWESPALEGPATVLQTGARGRRGGWQRRWIALQGPYLYILERQTSPTALAVIRMGSFIRAAYVPGQDVPVGAGGSGHGPIVALHHPTVGPAGICRHYFRHNRHIWV